MNKTWNVVLYRNQSGDYPVQQFIDSLELKAQAKIRNTIISRVENARTTPSLSFLKRMAEALHRELHISFT